MDRKTQDVNKRLRVLELQEKASGLMTSQSYDRALEYITVGLDMDPKNIVLLNQKALSLFRLGRYVEAIQANSEILLQDPSDESAVRDLLELYLIAGRLEEYFGLYSKHKAMVESKDGGMFFKYLESLRFYQQGDIKQLQGLVSEFVKTTRGKEKRARWQFVDVLQFLRKAPERQGKKLLIGFIKALDGQIESSEIQETS